MASPVTIQPPIADAPVYSWVPTTNYGTRGYGDVGETNTGVGTCKTVIKMDLSVIPSSATIDYSVLSLYYYDKGEASSPFDVTFSVRRLTSAFVENVVTWNVFPTDDGIDIGSTSIDEGTSFGWVDIVLNNAYYQELIDGTMTNNGFLIYNSNADITDNRVSFALREYATTAQRPKNYVEYTEFSGIPNVKTVNGIANADIKTINGVAVGDIKSLQNLFTGEWLRKLDHIRKGGLWISRNNGLVTI